MNVYLEIDDTAGTVTRVAIEHSGGTYQHLDAEGKLKPIPTPMANFATWAFARSSEIRDRKLVTALSELRGVPDAKMAAVFAAIDAAKV